MAAEERDNKIIDVLKKDIVQKKGKIAKKAGLTRQSTGRGLIILEKIGRVVHNKKLKLYALSENKDALTETIKNRSNDEVESITPYPLRRDHTDELKEAILLWINDFPTVTVYGMDMNKPNEPLRQPIYSLPFQIQWELPLENEIIFNDLLFHMEKQNEEIVDLWKEFKQISLVFHSKIEALVSEIAKDVVELINSKIAKGTANVKLKIAYLRWEVNSIHVHFLHRIYEACIIWAKDDTKELFNNYLQNFDPSSICIQSLFQYNLEYRMKEVGYAWIEQGLLNKEEFKNEMDDVFNKMIEKSKTDYYLKGKEIDDLILRLIKMEVGLTRLNVENQHLHIEY